MELKYSNQMALIYFEFDISKPKSNSHAAHKVPI